MRKITLASSGLLFAAALAAPAAARTTFVQHPAHQPVRADAFTAANSSLASLSAQNARFTGFTPIPEASLGGVASRLQRDAIPFEATRPIAIEPGDFEILPEPGAWAMLIVGFGLTGLIARRRRRHTFAQA